jgi:hypothetical protein
MTDSSMLEFDIQGVTADLSVLVFDIQGDMADGSMLEFEVQDDTQTKIRQGRRGSLRSMVWRIGWTGFEDRADVVQTRWGGRPQVSGGQRWGLDWGRRQIL